MSLGTEERVLPGFLECGSSLESHGVGRDVLTRKSKSLSSARHKTAPGSLIGIEYQMEKKSRLKPGSRLILACRNAVHPVCRQPIARRRYQGRYSLPSMVFGGMMIHGLFDRMPCGKRRRADQGPLILDSEVQEVDVYVVT